MWAPHCGKQILLHGAADAALRERVGGEGEGARPARIAAGVRAQREDEERRHRRVAREVALAVIKGQR